MIVRLQETDFESEGEVIARLIEGSARSERIFNIFFYSAVWCSQIRVLDRVAAITGGSHRDIGCDPRLQTFQQKNFYFQRCHLLCEAMDRLGELCRDEGFSPKNSSFYSHLDSNWQKSLLRGYEFRRKVSDNRMSLKSFAICIAKENHISANGFNLWPDEYDEQTDSFGLPCWERTWIIEKDNGLRDSIGRMEEESIVRMYRTIFDEQPLVDSETKEVLSEFSTWGERYQAG